MAVSRIERLMGRRQTNALILADPVTVVFVRKEKVTVPGGGWKWGPPTPLSPQQVTLVPFKRRLTEFLVNTELGPVPDLPYVLIGRHTLDIEEGDTFVYEGNQFEVKTIVAEHQDVQIVAQVDFYGETS